MKFAANLSMMFTEYDFIQRFQAAADNGFKAVEYLFPYEHDAGVLAGHLAKNSLQQVLFNMPPGNWDSGERGIASLPGRENEFQENVAIAISYAKALQCPRLHCMAGLRDDTIAYEVQQATYISNLRKAGERCKSEGIQLLIEPINSTDMPGYFLSSFDYALEILREVSGNFPDLIKLQFDIYHCQMIHGDVPAWLERCHHQTAHLQIAGVPGRHEPDIGTLPLNDIIAVCEALHKDLFIGCEYRPKGKTTDGLGWMKAHAT